MAGQKAFICNHLALAKALIGALRQIARKCTWFRGVYFCHALAIGLAIYCWGPLIDAKWGLTDDHEVMHFVGQQERLPPSQIFAKLEQTEISSSSTLPRFRPAYYLLRVVESVAWGKNPVYWYLFRIGIAAMLGLTLAHFCCAFAGPVITAVFLFFALSQPYWRDIFARAGPAETYCVLGACMVAWGWGAKLRTTVPTWSVFLIAAGTLIAAGSKENFLILGALPLWLLLAPQPRPAPAGRLICLVTLAVLAWFGLTILSRLQLYGMDVYNNDISPGSRLRLVGSFIRMPVVHLWMAGIALFALLDLHTRSRGRSGSSTLQSISATVPARGYCIALGLLLAIYAFQYLFYGEKWPGSAYERYLFPGVLASHLALLIGAVALLQIARTTWPSKSAVLACQLAMASAFMVPVIDWLTVNRQGSLETVRATQTIDRKFRIVTDALRKNPNMSVIIHSHNVWDLEPAIAIGRFLKADGLDNPVAMKISGYSSDQFPRGSLLNVVAGLSEKLSRGDLDNMTIALAAADTKNCFSIGLSGPPLGYCPHSLKLWPN